MYRKLIIIFSLFVIVSSSHAGNHKLYSRDIHPTELFFGLDMMWDNYPSLWNNYPASNGKISNIVQINTVYESSGRKSKHKYELKFDVKGRLIENLIYQSPDSTRHGKQLIVYIGDKVTTYEDYNLSGKLLTSAEVVYDSATYKGEMKIKSPGRPAYHKMFSFDKKTNTVTIEVIIENGKTLRRRHYTLNNYNQIIKSGHIENNALQLRKVFHINKEGQPEKVDIYNDAGKKISEELFEYKFDNVGNWTRRTTFIRKKDGTKWKNVEINRDIKYFQESENNPEASNLPKNAAGLYDNQDKDYSNFNVSLMAANIR